MRATPIPPDEERLDFIALRKRGHLLTDRDRDTLWKALNYFDVSRDAWAARIIKATPKGENPVSAVRAALAKHLATINDLARWEETVLARRLEVERRDLAERFKRHA